jgi:sulfonate transport system ATP-binding protein
METPVFRPGCADQHIVGEDRGPLWLLAGQFLAIVGRSGGGKTTVMRLLAGLDQPTGGPLEIAGSPVEGLQCSVRLLLQDARLLPWQTVVSNVGIARGSSEMGQ